mmetsp:Transcript_82283/g.180932  ORF Transcript_82283/g.180932 Transcript_82283/m.180932 type:complete len:1279 (-) Transcript_82283:122-3958(-)
MATSTAISEVATPLYEGQLVEVVGISESQDLKELIWEPGSEKEPPAVASAAAAGSSCSPRLFGKVLGIDDASNRYVIDTINAMRLALPEGNLRPYEPTGPSESGGFHFAWPTNAVDAAHFAAEAAQELATNGHCVVQLFAEEGSFDKAFQESSSPLLKYRSLRKELEAAYLGRGVASKAAWLEALAEEKEEIVTSLDEFDLILSQFTKLMVPLAPCSLDFVPYSRTNAMVRTPFKSATEENALRPYEVDEEDIAEGALDEHVQFLKRRHLCMLLVCRSEGGEVTLISKDPSEEPKRFSTTQGQLIVFRHDQMTFSYNPHSNDDVVLQAWILSEPDQIQNLKVETANQAFKDEIMGLVTGPKTPEGKQIDAMGIAVMFPSGAHNSGGSWWAAAMSGTDGLTRPPLSRFDMDPYYMPNETWRPGSSYTVHGGYCQVDIYAVDNEFFGIPESECYLMAPAQRGLLEKGYEALFRSGYRRSSLAGEKIGVFCGHSGDDWNFSPMFTSGSTDGHRAAYQSRIWSVITGRIAHTFGLKGPQQLVDTACSSALVAYGVGHTMLRREEANQSSVGCATGISDALVLGANMIPGPANFIALCGPHMLSVYGRCFTFNASADGFARGEGCAGFHVRMQEKRTEGITATMIGSCLNQDGRSASMTAPNGPSQQECIRGSMKEAGLRASEVTCAELHGTGTALGDPIEVGSLKGVMKDRVVPLLEASAKTHIGHLEAGAGIAGVIKCMLMCRACAGSPNCHLENLNPHLDITGYPTVIATELTDYGASSGYSGVSSFGFGGANSRADVFATAAYGPHATGALNLEKLDYITVTCPIDQGPMHYLDGKAVPLTSSVKYQRGPYHVDAIRDEFASYDYNSSLYSGKYLIHPRDEDYDEAPDGPIFIVGSWDGFQEPREMVASETEDGAYIFHVVLGDTRCERFQLHVNKDPTRAIFPVVPNGTMSTRVVGPDPSGEGLYWLLDGRDEEVPAGTIYRICLQWGEHPTMRWDIVESEAAPEWSQDCRHTFAVCGSWTSYMPEAMLETKHADGSSTFSSTLRINMSGVEGFYFMRDFDEDQCVYPMYDTGAQACPACGPDEHRGQKRWLLRGEPGQSVRVTIQVSNGHVTVAAVPGIGGSNAAAALGTFLMRAESRLGPTRHGYHISGSFTGGAYDEMEADSQQPGVFRYRGVMGNTGQETFSIAMDADNGLIYYPETSGSYPGESIVRGPEPIGQDRVFSLLALTPNAEFEIVLNLNAVDRRKVVDVKWLTERADLDSMKAAAYNYILQSGMHA